MQYWGQNMGFEQGFQAHVRFSRSILIPPAERPQDRQSSLPQASLRLKADLYTAFFVRPFALSVSFSLHPPTISSRRWRNSVPERLTTEQIAERHYAVGSK